MNYPSALIGVRWYGVYAIKSHTIDSEYINKVDRDKMTNHLISMIRTFASVVQDGCQWFKSLDSDLS